MATAPSARWHRLAVLAALMLAAFTFNTTENLPIGLLKLISADVQVSLSAVGYLVTAYGLTVALVSLPVAHATRSMPRRHVLTVLLAALVLSSLVSALGSSYWLLMVARLVTALAQALFWAVMGPVAVGLFAPAVRGRVIGVLSVAGSLALVLGVPLGTWLGQQSAWQVPLVVLAGLGLVSSSPSLFCSRRPGRRRGTRPTVRHPTSGGSGSCWRPPPCPSRARSRAIRTS